MLACTPASAHDGDPWYEDMEHHWAEEYVTVLWQEEVTDGYVGERSVWRRGKRRWVQYSEFRPDDPITKGQYAMMMAKVFRLLPMEQERATFVDVPRDYTEYEGKRAFGYIEAVNQARILVGNRQNRFFPGSLITRGSAVKSLICSLQLEPFATGMSVREIRLILSGFRDEDEIDHELRPYIALAVKLKIIEGYPDRTLGMDREIKRSEAAAILYRSCLVRADASPNPFSPDDDGIDDTTAFRIAPLKNRSAKRWQLVITNYHGDEIRKFRSPREPEGVGDEVTLVWDGKDRADSRLRPGTYYYRASVWDADLQEFSSALMPIVLEEKRLWGSIRPSTVEPGETMTIEAHTIGGAETVEASVQGISISLDVLNSAGGSSDWQKNFQIPYSTEPGLYRANLVATYPDGATRELELTYEVIVDFELSGEVSPNPAPAGHPITVTARTSKPVDRVSVSLPWNTHIPLSYTDQENWSCNTRIPGETRPGQYNIRIEAWKARVTRQLELRLDVIEDPTGGLRFVLTD